MFDEKEPGKPKNWGCTVTIIAVTTSINLSIFIICRVLLDSEDEFDTPLVKGKLREDITLFLGIFSLTFCFGCCCCFCCGGAIFRWICYNPCTSVDATHIWPNAIRLKRWRHHRPADERDIERNMNSNGKDESKFNGRHLVRNSYTNKAFIGNGTGKSMNMALFLNPVLGASERSSYEIRKSRSKSVS